MKIIVKLMKFNALLKKLEYILSVFRLLYIEYCIYTADEMRLIYIYLPDFLFP